jgi:DNA-binding PadR family transcriptional regulator
MYRDNTLIPSESIRLLALGILAEGLSSYEALANEVRHFTSHIAGPSLDLVGAPIEILRIEGLIAGEDDEDSSDQAILALTPSGRREFETLMTANLRAPTNELNRLVLMIKMRFLHLLEVEAGMLQAEIILEVFERQLARLCELRSHHADRLGHFVAWLDHEIAQARASRDWCRELHESL